jgi:hypothetical protein
MARSEEERISANEQMIERLKAENARLKKAIAEKERKIDTRRKIIAGSIVLKHAGYDKHFAMELEALLARFVPERDRHLFGLKSKAERGAKEAPSLRQ